MALCPRPAVGGPLTQALGAMSQRDQLRQTIISTGCVGAFFGLLPAFASLALRSERGHAETSSLFTVAAVLDFGITFAVSVVFCIVAFGLVPMTIQQGFVWLARHWSGRA
jgi:hypothetical protein